MIIKLVEEIEKALKHELYLVALNTALTLPDICGCALYPKLGTTARYKKWYSEYVGKYEKFKEDTPSLSADVVYSLRNSFVHQGNPNIKKGTNNIDKFILNIQKEEILLVDTVSKISNQYTGVTRTEYNVNVRRLCFILCNTAKQFYLHNKSLFDFFNYHIHDLDKQFEKVMPFLTSFIDNINKKH